MEEIKIKNILNVDKIEKYYGNKGNITKAIDNRSFRVKEGEFVGIMDLSGSGKTTLLNCISTIDSVSTGNIIINYLMLFLTMGILSTCISFKNALESGLKDITPFDATRTMYLSRDNEIKSVEQLKNFSVIKIK